MYCFNHTYFSISGPLRRHDAMIALCLRLSLIAVSAEIP
jgi:hypothetical protein